MINRNDCSASFKKILGFLEKIAPVRHALEQRRAERIRTRISELMQLPPTTRSMTDRDMILGFATGYDVGALRPFVESLRSTQGRNIKAALFVLPNSDEVNAYLTKNEIEVVTFAPMDGIAPNVALARSFAYFDFLAERWKRGLNS